MSAEADNRTPSPEDRDSAAGGGTPPAGNAPGKGAAGPALDEDTRTQLLMLVLGELEPEQRERILRRAESEPLLAVELRALTAHLKVHQGVRQAGPKRGSLGRLAGRMQDEGYLEFAVPGEHSLWRRSFWIAALVLVIFAAVLVVIERGRESMTPERTEIGMLHLIRNEGAAPAPQPITIGKEVALGDDEGELRLASGERNVLTSIRFARGSRFVLESPGILRLHTGEALAVRVDQRASYPGGFRILTPQAVLAAQDSAFSVKISAGMTRVGVVHGRVDAGMRGSDPVRMITEGFCAVVRDNQPPDEPFAMIGLKVESFGQPLDRQVLITVTNHWTERLYVQGAGGPPKPVYELSIVKDSVPGSEEPFSQTFEALPVPGLPRGRGGPEIDHLGWIKLDPEGPFESNQYKFVADQTAPLGGVPMDDFTIAIRYRGVVRSDHFGEFFVNTISPYMRLNLKAAAPGG